MTWSNYEKQAEKGPWGLFKVCVVAILFLTGLGIVIGVINRSCSVADEAAGVAQKEFGAKALLTKYEWFKEASAQLDAKLATLKIYQASVAKAEKNAKDRTDKERLAVRESEFLGIKASYNLLAAEYNARMAEFNWKFTNRGDLPAGATVILPREFKPYEEE